MAFKQTFTWGPTAFKALDGVFCVYKPTGLTSYQCINKIQRNLLTDLNALPCYEHELRIPIHKQVKVNTRAGEPVSTHVPVGMEDLSEHRLVLGKRYTIKAVESMNFVHQIGEKGSGVLVCGVGREAKEYLQMISMAKYLRVYHVKGQLGYCTQNCWPDGSFVERATYKHVNKGKMDKVCSAAQSTHQRLMFKYAGVDPQSQDAYDLACGGLIRPTNNLTPPILYGVKCIYFNPPEFTLEVHAINEDTDYLARLVDDIGASLKTRAVCTHSNRIRYGHFKLEYTLLKRDWNLENIVENIRKCRPQVTPKKLSTNLTIKKTEIETRDEQLSIMGDNDPSAESILKSLTKNSKKLVNTNNKLLASDNSLMSENS